MTSRQKAQLISRLATAKKAENVVVLDMRRLSNITDFFIIASASSAKRAQTVADSIESGLLARKELTCGIEGYDEGRWILIDAYDVVAHVFSEELRSFYNLEGLWGDAPRTRLCQRRKKTKKRSRKVSKRR